MSRAEKVLMKTITALIKVIVSADYPKVRVQNAYHTYIECFSRINSTGNFVNGVNATELENVETTSTIKQVREDLFRIFSKSPKTYEMRISLFFLRSLNFLYFQRTIASSV